NITTMLCLFSSRRRHTSSYGDWSSGVCSSDLYPRCRRARTLSTRGGEGAGASAARVAPLESQVEGRPEFFDAAHWFQACISAKRSEERRVGKELCARLALAV